MASTFPSSADVIATDKSDDTLAIGDHPAHHDQLGFATMAVEQTLLGLVDANLSITTPSGDPLLLINRAVGANAPGIRLRTTSNTASIGVLLDNTGTTFLGGLNLKADGSLQIVSRGTSGSTLASALTIAAFVSVASSVNYIQITNSATGNPLNLAALGADTNISIVLVPKGTGIVTTNADLSSRRHKATGTNLVAGDFALSAGWGTGASVSAVASTSNDQRGQITVTAGSASFGANPTVTMTFKDGTWTTVPFVQWEGNGGTGLPSGVANTTVANTATTSVLTWLGTPTSGQTFNFQWVAMG